jgi:RNA polymerase sigma-70 factor (ECF subfamily)
MKDRIASVEGQPLDENRLVERAKNGDADAYEQLVQRYAGLAFRAAYLITQSSQDAEDASQEAFVKAHRALPRFRPGAAFRPWLMQIVANEARDRRRAAGRRDELTLRAGEGLRTGDVAPSPESAVVALEDRAQLLGAINRLREEDRLVIACRYFLDLSTEETAAAIGCPTGTVKSRLSRALDRLKQLYEVSRV